MTPEERARQVIDRKLVAAGWVVQDFKSLNLGAARGVAVRENQTDTAPADYFFVDREAAGVSEAKRDEASENITKTEQQAARYANAMLKWRVKTTPRIRAERAARPVAKSTRPRKPKAIA